MDMFVVYGTPGSPYVRSVFLALAEKDLPWRYVALGGGEHRWGEHIARHPFGKVPAVTHGDFSLYETQAILRYIDRIAPAPPLTPSDPRAEARMNQIIGILDSYVIRYVSGGISFPRGVAPMFGLPTDEAQIAEALPGAEICMTEIDRLLGGRDYLADDAVSLADLMVIPHLSFFARVPEGAAMFARRPRLAAWLERMEARAAMVATEWDRMARAA